MRRLIGFLWLFLSSLSAALAIDWKPVDPADLAVKAGRVDPTADAEALFWEVWVADEAANNQYPYTTYTHYLRVKLFNDRAVKRFGTVDIEYRGKESIGEIAGRTISPDGSIRELGRDAIFDRIIEKRKHEKVHAVSFAMPGVSVGSIIEYHWRQSDTDALANYVPLFAYRDIPVEHLIWHLKPLNNPYWPYTMKYRPFHVNLPPFRDDNRGWFRSELSNLAAFDEEEDAPPRMETCPWVLIYYSEDRKENLDRFWKSEGKKLATQYKEAIKVNGDVKSLAGEITTGAKSADDKLRLLALYCQKKVKNVSSSETSDTDRQNFKPNKNSIDTLKRGIGTSMDVRLAFAALADAADFDARVAHLCDRETMLFHREMMIPWLPETDIAVDVDGKWKIYDVTSRFVQPGHLHWYEEGVNVLVADEKDPEWIYTDFTPSADSQYRYQGQIKIDEQGTLEGDLHDTLTGHPADEWRETYSASSAAERDKRIIESLTSRLPGAEITELKSTDPADLSTPVSMQFHIRMPGYATRTGKRLFFSPAVFETNQPARYTASTRKYDIMFRYPWSEQEDISIKTPAGYELDHADSPMPLKLGPVGGYEVKILKLPDRLLYHRDFEFAKNGSIYYPSSGYPVIKQAFDTIHERDTHLLTLKVQQPVASAATTN